jgi:hypothetical protein
MFTKVENILKWIPCYKFDVQIGCQFAFFWVDFY